MEETNIERLAKMARLDLSDEEKKSFTGQFASILDYVKKIQELDLPSAAPQMAYAADLVNVWREDIAKDCTVEDQNNLIDAFPESVGRMNSVPAIFENRG